ncbi:hypothetical protein [Dyella sp. C11]|uniref:hypothetical protein n=1 Tax=Dyella sp. C11 TaxID=2126991 RepID=UPI001300A74E|nr:hypothetical protein [Dyella sp. C11]
MRELQELSAHRSATLAKKSKKGLLIHIVSFVSPERNGAEKMTRKDVGSVTFVLPFSFRRQQKSPADEAGLGAPRERVT